MRVLRVVGVRVQYSLKELPSLQTAYDWCSVNVVEDSFVCRTFGTESTIDDLASGEDAGPFQVTKYHFILQKSALQGKANAPIRLFYMCLCAFSVLGAGVVTCSRDYRRVSTQLFVAVGHSFAASSAGETTVLPWCEILFVTAVNIDRQPLPPQRTRLDLIPQHVLTVNTHALL